MVNGQKPTPSPLLKGPPSVYRRFETQKQTPRQKAPFPRGSPPFKRRYETPYRRKYPPPSESPPSRRAPPPAKSPLMLISFDSVPVASTNVTAIHDVTTTSYCDVRVTSDCQCNFDVIVVNRHFVTMTKTCDVMTSVTCKWRRLITKNVESLSYNDVITMI